MADYIFYYFSDEEDGEDALLDRAFDRWEQMGGGSARSPLFQFNMQLADDPVGAMSWSGLNSMRNCVN